MRKRFDLRGMRICTITGLLVLAGCAEQGPPESSEPAPELANPQSENTATDHPSVQSPRFTDVSTLISHQYEPGFSDQRHIVETMGAGLAVLDFDRDGDMDLFLPQGGNPHSSSGHPSGGRLWENRFIPEGVRSFRDVTDELGVSVAGYTLGVTVGDPNADGWPDLYISNYGPDQLLINRNGKLFEDQTESWGIQVHGMSSGALFLDMDDDGDQDLFVAQYVNGEDSPYCEGRDGRRDYCAPGAFTPLPNRVLRNTEGRFADDTLLLPPHSAAPSLSVVPIDINADGRLDILIANDGKPNRLWVRQTDGSYSDAAAEYGLAVNLSGQPEASMGIDWHADDGNLSILMSHFRAESNTLYQQLDGGVFMDFTMRTAMASASLPYTGWGVRWLDYNGDLVSDLLVVNGAVNFAAKPIGQSSSYAAMAEPNQAFSGLSQNGLKDTSETMPESFTRAENSRGLVTIDLENDGDEDFIVLNAGGLLQVFENELNPQHFVIWHFLDANGDSLRFGGTVQLTIGQRIVSLPLHGLGGYLSVSDPRIIVALSENIDAAVFLSAGREDISLPLEKGLHQVVVRP